MLLAISRVYFSLHPQGLFTPSEQLIRVRKIGLHDENVVFRCAKAPQHRHFGLFHGQRVLVAEYSA